MEHFAVSAIASLSRLMEGSVKCARKKNGSLLLCGICETDGDGDGDIERMLSVEGVWAPKEHCFPRDWQREHGDALSQAVFAKKHSSQDCFFLPGLAAAGGGWLCFLAQILLCLRATSLDKNQIKMAFCIVVSGFTYFFKKDLLQKGQLEQEAPVSIGLSARSAYLKRHDVQGPNVLLHVEANGSFAGRTCCIASTET